MYSETWPHKLQEVDIDLSLLYAEVFCFVSFSIEQKKFLVPKIAVLVSLEMCKISGFGGEKKSQGQVSIDQGQCFCDQVAVCSSRLAEDIMSACAPVKFDNICK